MSGARQVLDRGCVVLSEEEPDMLRQGYQTIAEPAAAAGFDLLSFRMEVQSLLNAIETAAETERLGLYRRRNLLTGAHGLIVGEGLFPGDRVIATAFAELLAPWPSELNEHARTQYRHLYYCALHRKLSTTIFTRGPDGGGVAFAGVVLRDTTEARRLSGEFLARLLTSEGETSQWPARVGSSPDPVPAGAGAVLVTN